MRPGTPPIRTALLTVMAASGTIAAGMAIAQPMEVVTVEAARAVTVGQSTIGAPVDEITIKSRVSYADLDLTSATGALNLETRIREAATAACNRIDATFPAAGSTTAGCIKDATDRAMVEARKVIEAKRSAVAKK